MIPHVAIAPVPFPPTILILGATVYPAPAFVSKSSLIEKTLLSVVIATADAFTPIDASLDVEMNTVGVDVYPDPSFKIVSEFIKPD